MSDTDTPTTRPHLVTGKPTTNPDASLAP